MWFLIQSALKKCVKRERKMNVFFSSKQKKKLEWTLMDDNNDVNKKEEKEKWQ